VLKLRVCESVEREAVRSPASLLLKLCVATTVSAPLQFIVTSILESFTVPGSIETTTSSWPEAFPRSAGLPS